MNSDWSGKRILITGVCGTIGQELLIQLLKNDPDELIGVDNNESALFYLDEHYSSERNVQLFLCDIREKNLLSQLMEDVDIVLHAAAFKHVLLCEKSPQEAVQCNIAGTQNIIEVAKMKGVNKVIFTSSDKAVNPTNVMGTSKLMGERLMTAANAYKRRNGPILASTRFGNVLGSRGSVVPLFKQQIAAGGPVTITDTGMTRFVMTLQEAVRLVLESTFLACGGEVFVTKMSVVKISDLARVMIDELASGSGYDPKDIEIEVIGSKPGEKLYEELMNTEETRRTIELPDYFVLLPAFKSVYEMIDYSYPGMSDVGVEKVYNSSSIAALSQEELKAYMQTNGLL